MPVVEEETVPVVVVTGDAVVVVFAVVFEGITILIGTWGASRFIR